MERWPSERLIDHLPPVNEPIYTSWLSRILPKSVANIINARMELPGDIMSGLARMDPKLSAAVARQFSVSMRSTQGNVIMENADIAAFWKKLYMLLTDFADESTITKEIKYSVSMTMRSEDPITIDMLIAGKHFPKTTHGLFSNKVVAVSATYTVGVRSDGDVSDSHITVKTARVHHEGGRGLTISKGPLLTGGDMFGTWWKTVTRPQRTPGVQKMRRDAVVDDMRAEADLCASSGSDAIAFWYCAGMDCCECDCNE